MKTNKTNTIEYGSVKIACSFTAFVFFTLLLAGSIIDIASLGASYQYSASCVAMTLSAAGSIFYTYSRQAKLENGERTTKGKIASVVAESMIVVSAAIIVYAVNPILLWDTAPEWFKRVGSAGLVYFGLSCLTYAITRISEAFVIAADK